MTFLELQNRVSKLLNFTPTAASQDFTAQNIKDELNSTYEDEVNRGQLEGSRLFFRASQDVTWPQGQLTFVLPSPLDARTLIRVTDVTSSDPGVRLVITETGLKGDIFWKDRNTLQ